MVISEGERLIFTIGSKNGIYVMVKILISIVELSVMMMKLLDDVMIV